MDDPLFVWAAKQIRTEPLDFYGFDVNWYTTDMPMYDVMKNPPLTSYFIAAASALVGWGEVGLHLAFIIPALGVTLGTYVLASRLCSRPLFAALLTVLTPVFVVSSTTLMSDTLTLCFWIWAIITWMEGLEKKRLSMLMAAALLITASALTKYYGASLIPLLLIYSCYKTRRPGMWLLTLLIPVVVLAVYQWATHAAYGRGLFLDAAGYASRAEASIYPKLLTGLAFAGGCMASVIWFLPFLVSRKMILPGVMTVVIASVAVVAANSSDWTQAAQKVLFVVAGIGLMALAIADLWSRRDAESLLLFLWMAGTFAFTVSVNWSISGRSVLPMAPAAGILIMRRLDGQSGDRRRRTPVRRLVWLLVPAAAVAVMAGWADYSLARANKEAADRVHSRLAYESETVWFQGHWGFQYYMEALGARIVDRERSRFRPGDFLVLPVNNTNVFSTPSDVGDTVERIEIESCRWLSTMNPFLQAGFYSDVWGTMPFVFGIVPPEQVYIVRLKSRPLPATPPGA